MYSLVCCGVLVGCTAEAAPPPAAPPEAAPEAPLAHSTFAATTESPRAALAQSSDAAQRTLSDTCGESDAALLSVAAQLLEQRTETLDVDAIGYDLRAAGAPYVWPRAWLFTGGEGELETARTRMIHWLAGFADGGTRRCGVAVRHDAGGRLTVAALAVDALADLDPTPTRVRVGSWINVRAVLRVPASDAKLVILGPRGAPHAVPTSFSDGRVQARFNADQP
ncbi:MAG: hypothetical protein ABJA94_11000, partial [Rhodoglobus sp.]